MNISIPTAAIFLDVEKAFDRVWHAGLVHKMTCARTPGAFIHLIKHYLTNRKFHVVVENEASSTRLILAGAHKQPKQAIYHHASFNPSKSTAVFFQGRRSHKIPEPISIEGLPIAWCKQAKYLGVVLDESLTFKQHQEEDRCICACSVPASTSRAN
ncbi:hypothetical protein Trydic_g1810 [Trypoxylus dichotomus]